MGRRSSRLGFRLAAASGLLALVIGATFAVLLVAVDDVRKTGRLADRSRMSLSAADGIGELVLDLETGARGFVITEQERFLGPWRLALARFPARARELESLAEGAGQSARARQIVTDARSYIRDYSIPLVRAVRRGSPAASSVAVTAAGRRRVDAIRARLDDFAAAESARLDQRQSQSDTDAQRAIWLAVAGVIGSFLLIAAFAVYLLRSVARPVRRVASTAGRLAEGDYSARLPEEGTGEIGELERSFNLMAGSLERNRDELIASRARIVEAADEARRRIRRDLHDGGQQRLVHALITLKLARRSLEGGDDARTEELIDEALGHTEGAVEALRELSHGILPATLARGGLRAAVEATVGRMSLPVRVEISDERFPPAIEATAYFVVGEALTNVVKHAEAKGAEVSAQAADGVLGVEIRDDGKGGAALDGGSGLAGLRDRVAALSGELEIESPPGGGTRVTMTLPVRQGAGGAVRAGR